MTYRVVCEPDRSEAVAITHDGADIYFERGHISFERGHEPAGDKVLFSIPFADWPSFSRLVDTVIDRARSDVDSLPTLDEE